jgi:phosphoribosylaminoimidazole carboxylase (NCAIR synthetase)
LTCAVKQFGPFAITLFQVQGIEASVALLLGNCFLINILGTNKGHNDRLSQPTSQFSLAAIFIMGKKKKREARIAQEVQDHIKFIGLL